MRVCFRSYDFHSPAEALADAALAAVDAAAAEVVAPAEAAADATAWVTEETAEAVAAAELTAVADAPAQPSPRSCTCVFVQAVHGA